MNAGTWSERAFGKVILLGEHAVVYGHPGLAGALARGVVVTARPGSGKLSLIHGAASADSPDRQELLTEQHPLGAAYDAILRTFGVRRATLSIDLSVEFAVPAGTGLGSSAAFAVALSKAVARALSLDDEPRIMEAALAAETVFHGRPSGIDQAVAHRGGFGVFRRDDGLRGLTADPLTLCVAFSGRRRDTREVVGRVADAYRAEPSRVSACFERIAGCVDDGMRALVEGDLEALGHAMQRNQRELVELGVSSPELDALCSIARAHGALGAKLTGAGGGGCAIALAVDADRLCGAFRKAGFASFVATIGTAYPSPGEHDGGLPASKGRVASTLAWNESP